MVQRSFWLLASALAIGPLSGCQVGQWGNKVRLPELTTTARPYIPSAPTPPVASLGGEIRGNQEVKLKLLAAEEMEKGGKFAPAIQLYEQVREANPNADSQIAPKLAVLYDREGQFDRALVEYEKALKYRPKDADLYADMGYGYLRRDQLAEAEGCLRRAVELNPRLSRAWNNLGMALAQQNRDQESLTAFERAVGKAQAQCNLAFVRASQGRVEEAKQGYELALRLEPNLSVARKALIALNNPDLARRAEEMVFQKQQPRRDSGRFADESLNPPLITNTMPRQSMGGYEESSK